MMDQIQSELALHGVDHIPAGWQFVHIDVPVGAKGEAEGLGSVEDLGGMYFGTGAKGIPYSVLDDSVTQSLQQSQSLGSIATWAPRMPEQVNVTIAEGAGQYRAVGRMITLSKPREIRQALSRAWDNLSRVETTSEMSALNIPGLGDFNAEESPIVLVVSSMAGGAGASMALDVARLLTLLPGLQPNLLGMFMVSADIFGQLPPAALSGVRANSLAMLGEIVATQTGAAREHDVATLTALGQQNGVGAPIPFQRVFPVGRFVGAQRTLFGDGSQQAVYRGLGRGLAALMMSGSASTQFVAYDLTNVGGISGNRSALGWGASWDTLPWGSFGFSSLSMGRERYREYAAQRLARTSVDRLLSGHLQEGNAAPAEQQIGRLLENQWPRTIEALGLPASEGAALTSQQLMSWYTDVALPRTSVDATTKELADVNLAQNLPLPGVTPGADWLGVVHQKLRDRHTGVAAGITDAAARWAYAWQQSFVTRLTEVVEEAVATFGLAYGTALLNRLEAHIGNTLVSGMHEMSLRGKSDISTIDPTFAAKIASMRGVIANGQEMIQQLISGFRGIYRDALYGQAAALGEQILADSVSGVIAPLKAALAEGHVLLQGAGNASLDSVGLAKLETEVYAAWPSDGDLAVPSRFDVANNEVLLTPSSAFPPRYQADVRASVDSDGADATFVAARATVIGQIIAGRWKTTGSTPAPGGYLDLDSPWRSRAFSVNPFTNEVEVPVNARFTLRARVGDLLSRARQYVGRPSTSFDNFCKVSLRQFVLGEKGTESEVAGRQNEVAVKFREALTLARPLISVNTTAVQKLHNEEMAYRYKFSEVPFNQIPKVSGALEDSISRDPAVEQTSLTNLKRALTANESVTRIDIFGSYPNYSPLAFDSVLGPIAEEWAALPTQGRGDWWKWRRARPLTASLPMSESERRTMVTGWFVGQLVGDIRLPEEPYSAPVEIWNAETGVWEGFPNPLLTPHSSFIAQYDWLPAVLESSLLAIARAHEMPVLDSLIPYRLLRELHDTHPSDPTNGLVEKSSALAISNWIASGAGASGAPTKVSGLTAGQTAEQRAAAARRGSCPSRISLARSISRPASGVLPAGERSASSPTGRSHPARRSFVISLRTSTLQPTS